MSKLMFKREKKAAHSPFIGVLSTSKNNIKVNKSLHISETEIKIKIKVVLLW